MAIDAVDSGLIRRSVPLAQMTTYRFGGEAAWLGEPTNMEQLNGVIDAAHRLAKPIVVLGRGSNVVISDEGLDAVVVRLGGEFAAISVDPDGSVAAGAGAPLARVARTSVDADRGGLEFLVGVPGSVGGAVRMNAGCLGSETSDWMVSARLIDIATRKVATMTPADLDMGYRHAVVRPDQIVLSARFHTIPQSGEAGRSRIREVTQWRRSNQPGGTLNAGSVFKNPPGDAAGRIIDELGLKGLAVGGVRVSPRHANFFEAHAGATPQHVFDLVTEVQRRVRSATDVVLEPEVKFLGHFAANEGSDS